MLEPPGVPKRRGVRFAPMPMPMQMPIAIVMPVLQEGDSLLQRLRALAPLRARGVRLVVVDGGSTDGTWAIARAHADCVLLAARGRASQMNAGVSACLTDAAVGALLFLHADTVLPADADGQVRQALAQGNHWGRFDVRIDGPHPLLRVVERMMNGRSRLTGIATGDQAIFVSRSAWQKVGGFAEQPLMEDIDICARLKRLGPPACIASPVRTSARRWQKHGTWRTVLLMWHLRAAYFFGAKPAALALRYGYAPIPGTASAAVVILAKAPVPGLAKTRLAPALGLAGAARAQRRFALQTLQCARAAALGPVALWCAPDVRHRFFRAVATQVDAVLAQPDGDLAQRMGAAFVHHFAQTPGLPLLLVGTDCPALTPGHLQAAARTLQSHDVVIIPAEDGGYVLIGMRRWVPQALQNIAWSTDQVLAQTRAQLQACGSSWQELPTLWDVDEPADWARLQAWLG